MTSIAHGFSMIITDTSTATFSVRRTQIIGAEVLALVCVGVSLGHILAGRDRILTCCKPFSLLYEVPGGNEVDGSPRGASTSYSKLLHVGAEYPRRVLGCAGGLEQMCGKSCDDYS